MLTFNYGSPSFWDKVVLKGDAITADPTAIRFFIYHSNIPPNYAQLLKEQNKTKDDECQECADSRDKVEIPLDKPVGTIKCKNQVTIIKKRIAGFDGVETRLVFLPLDVIWSDAKSRLILFWLNELALIQKLIWKTLGVPDINYNTVSDYTGVR